MPRQRFCFAAWAVYSYVGRHQNQEGLNICQYQTEKNFELNSKYPEKKRSGENWPLGYTAHGKSKP